MLSIISLISTLVIFLFALSILVIFHELGHFLVARAFGIKVVRFSCGFGKPLLRFKDKKDTEYVIAAVPLGGYVKMLDEREVEVSPELQNQAFNRQPVLIRIAVVMAGPLFNIIFAVLMFWLMYMVGIQALVPIAGEIDPGSIAQYAGFHEGDEILAIGDKQTRSWDDVNLALIAQLGNTGQLNIKVKSQSSGHIKNLFITLPQLPNEQDYFIPAYLGIHQYLPPIPPILAKIIPAGPADQAGLKVGDRVIAVNKIPIDNWQQLVNAIDRHTGQLVKISVMREGKLLELTLKPTQKETISNRQVSYIGVQSKMFQWPSSLIRTQQYSILQAFEHALVKTWDTIKLTVGVIIEMLKGFVSVHAISGPIGIAQGASMSASMGIAYFLDFLGLMSVSLGILNILPIPILDGGHLLFYFIELVRGKPVSQTAQMIGMRIGIILLIALMSLAFYNDIARLFTS